MTSATHPPAWSPRATPALDLHADRVADLRQGGVRIFDSLDDLLAMDEVEAVWLPVPIDLHLPFTRAALKAGKAVMCEKPAAGCIQDVDAMIAARDASGLPVAIGFQDVYDAVTLPAKRAVLDGQIGTLRAATLHGCWPRTSTYFRRSAWAGTIERNGTWVLDSPMNNAMAHFVNIGLFLMGPTPDTSAQPLALDAELYRSANIQNYDTCSVRVELDRGNAGDGSPVDYLISLTHAAQSNVQPTLALHGDRGTLHWSLNGVRITSPTGDTEVQIDAQWNKHQSMLCRFARLVRGVDDPDTALATLEVARAHSLIVSAASQAAPIVDVPADAIETIEKDGSEIRSLPGIADAFARAAEDRTTLHATGRYPFTQPPRRIEGLREYQQFSGPA